MKFEQFLKDFIPKLARKSKALNQAYWLLETTGSSDAADLKTTLDTDLRLLFHDEGIYKQLLEWEKEPLDPIRARELNILLRAFKQNLISKALLEEMAQKESDLAMSYANFRPTIDGEKFSENQIRSILKNEKNIEKRKKAWEASKLIGEVLAPKILNVVLLRNKGAKELGYSDYFQMQLELQEVDPKWLLKTLDDLALSTEKAYLDVIKEIEKDHFNRFQVKDFGVYGWTDPFCQEDPIDSSELDTLVDGVDLVQSANNYYQMMGVDVKPILDRSDMYERVGKNQHAFCMNVDRDKDVRTLNNVQPSLKWLETVLHELGHGIYELGFSPDLPFLLREPPHMITTEAMALIAGRQAYKSESLIHLVGEKHEPLRKKADQSLKRRQLIFSRWVMVMTAFESELYRNPNQDLNKLWWELVEKYQKIKPPQNRVGKWDWATKYHIGLAPVYYFSYLLGEMFASEIQEALSKETGKSVLHTKEAAQFLHKKLFNPGNRHPWHELVQSITGKPLGFEAWIKEFAT